MCSAIAGNQFITKNSPDSECWIRDVAPDSSRTLQVGAMRVSRLIGLKFKSPISANRSSQGLDLDIDCLQKEPFFGCVEHTIPVLYLSSVFGKEAVYTTVMATATKPPMRITLSRPVEKYVRARAKEERLSRASDYVDDLIRDDQEKREAKKHLEQLLLEGINSGPAVRMTPKRWEKLWKDVETRIKARNHGKS